MTKSQNTIDEQQNDLYITNEQVTEQWEKGELPDGHYYVRDGENLIAELLDGYFYNNGEPMTSFSGGVDTILAEVPSFEQWQEYKNANDSMFDTIKMLNKDNYKLEKENTKLKEVMKECKECFELLTNDNSPWCPDGADDLLFKINQVLGE